VTYYVLPAALLAAVAQGFVLHELPEKAGARLVRLVIALLVVLQPSLLLHLQYQFYGGVITALVFMLLVVALFQAHAGGRGGGWELYAVVAVAGVWLAGLYTVKLTLLVWALTAGAALARLAVSRVPREGEGGAPGAWVAVLLAAVGVLAMWRIRVWLPEAWSAEPTNGRVGHVWMQWGAIFGGTEILPWYAPDGAGGAEQHRPADGVAGVWLLGLLLAVYGWQCWRWYRERRELLPVLVLLAVAGTGWLAMPPQGSHWHVSRVLPIIGPALLAGCAAAAWFGWDRRWTRWLAVGLVCVPVVRAWPELARHFSRPDCRMIAGEWRHPPDPFVWGALGYAYFYEETEDIDWSMAPESFRAMTHYMPEEIRPRLRERPGGGEAKERAP
jgi:hypothetical protein